ncbi:MAG TPA: hypothetical protein VM241_02070 [Candidatus Thermoplasmatota archaeon]|nr:hypothetical protein [Candidatus Thermoplasmatota archaeon]
MEAQRGRIGFLSLRPVAALAAADWGLAVGAYAAALLVRALIVHAHPYTAEAAHFVLARDLWATNPAVAGLDGTHPEWGWLFWQRPLFSLLLWPGAAVSFTGYRVLHVLVASLLPALGALLLRHLGVPRWLAGGAAAVAILHPLFVPWNVLVLPDSLMAVLFLGALLAAERGHPLASALLCLAACWTKEVAAVGAIALLALGLWREPDGVRARLYPLAIGRWSTLYLATLLLAFAPLAYSLGLPWARFPGWGVGGDGNVVLERVFVVLWLAPVPLLGLLDARTRRLAVVALAWSGFFVAYHFVLGKAVEAWYYVTPATLVLLATAAGLAALWRRAGPGRSRLLPAGATLLVAALMALQVAVPDNVAAKQAIVAPLSGQGQWDLEQALAYESGREQGLYDAMAGAPGNPHGTWVTVDTDWSFWAYPMAARTGNVVAYFTGGVKPLDRDADALAAAIGSADATILHKLDTPANVAIRAAYQECTPVTSGDYVLILGRGCPPGAPRLHAAADAAGR